MRTSVSTWIIAAAITVASASVAHATDYYVATNGNDGGPGTQSSPWQTIAYAVSAASPVGAGDTIYVRAGTYPGYVQVGKSGGVGAPITLRPYGTEKVILTTGGQYGNIAFRDLGGGAKTNWTIQGLEIRDSSGGAGIWIEDGGQSNGTVTIQDNIIHNTDSGDNASCIFIQRNLGTFIIRRNVLYDCDGTNPGNNTGIVIFGHINTGRPGNVSFVIQNNEIYNEGVGIKIKHPFASDQVVNVDISYNIIRNVYAKGAISTAGGKFTTNKTNRIHHNLIYNSTTSPGVEVGDDFDEYGVEVDHNTIYNMGNAFVLCLADNCSDGGSRSINLHDNIFVPVARSGTNGYGIWTEVTATPFTSSDYNCFWTMSTSTDVANWGGYGGGVAQSLSQWQGRGLDARSVRVNPSFVNASQSDFRLIATSPCKNLRGNGRDPGAYETGSEVIGPGGSASQPLTPPANLRIIP